MDCRCHEIYAECPTVIAGAGTSFLGLCQALGLVSPRQVMLPECNPGYKLGVWVAHKVQLSGCALASNYVLWVCFVSR